MFPPQVPFAHCFLMICFTGLYSSRSRFRMLWSALVAEPEGRMSLTVRHLMAGHAYSRIQVTGTRWISVSSRIAPREEN
jgi:hypothetical protein